MGAIGRGGLGVSAFGKGHREDSGQPPSVLAVVPISTGLALAAHWYHLAYESAPRMARNPNKGAFAVTVDPPGCEARVPEIRAPVIYYIQS